MVGRTFSRLAYRPRRGTTAAALASECGKYDVTDEQWESIAHLFIGKIVNPASGRLPTIEMRTAMNGILTKLRTGCAWKQMPERYGNGAGPWNIMQRIQYHHIRDRIRDILNQRFPEVLKGLPDDPFQGWVRQTAKKTNTAIAGKTPVTASAESGPSATG